MTISDMCLDDLVYLAAQYPLYENLLDSMVSAGVITSGQLDDLNVVIEAYCPAEIPEDYDQFDFQSSYSCPNGCSGEPEAGAAATGTCI